MFILRTKCNGNVHKHEENPSNVLKIDFKITDDNYEFDSLTNRSGVHLYGL
jgi:hypothetical protein